MFFLVSILLNLQNSLYLKATFVFFLPQSCMSRQSDANKCHMKSKLGVCMLSRIYFSKGTMIRIFHMSECYNCLLQIFGCYWSIHVKPMNNSKGNTCITYLVCASYCIHKSFFIKIFGNHLNCYKTWITLLNSLYTRSDFSFSDIIITSHMCLLIVCHPDVMCCCLIHNLIGSL